MQIRGLVAVGARTLSSGLPIHPPSLRLAYLPAAHPNAPLGAGLCIFNKFRESSKPAISAGGCSEGGFSAASQTVSSRLFMCEESSQSSLRGALLPPRPRHSFWYFPSSLSCRSHTLFLRSSFYLSFSSSSSCSASSLFLRIFFSPAFEQLTFHRSSSSPSFFFRLTLHPLSLHPLPPHVPHTRAALSRALYLGAVSIRVWNTGNRTTRVY